MTSGKFASGGSDCRAGILGLNKQMVISLAKGAEEGSHPLKTSLSSNPLVLEQCVC